MFKKEKGITLVALVVTIIVLLILAAVSINIAFNTGIIAESKNAVNSYKGAEENEQTTLNNVVSYMENETNTVIQ